jgi:2,3-bisphosphoglycerate-dependent phosphoglycerate mutase
MNKLLIILSFSLIPFFTLFEPKKEIRLEANNQITTFIIVRHGEKENNDKDPNLSTDGKLRAEALRNMLTNVDVNAIYSTNYKRTRQTALPLATEKGIEIQEYPAQKPHKLLIEEILTNNLGKTIIIVGHSNTVPGILKSMDSNSQNITINENQFDNLFIVHHSIDGNSKVLNLKYGKSTP